MESNIHLILLNEDKLVACIDNNQKGFGMKYQQYGKSCKYAKVTGCVLKIFSHAINAIEDRN